MAQATLRTQRLELVPLSDEHLEYEVELDADPQVMRYLSGRGRSRAEVEALHRERLDAAQPVDGLGFWAGFADRQFVGWWILEPAGGPDQEARPGDAVLGYRLLRRFWRRGYGSEGARELVRHGFDELGLQRIVAQTMAVNAASRATMAAAGLSPHRAFVSEVEWDDVVDGAEHGEVEYVLTRGQWTERENR